MEQIMVPKNEKSVEVIKNDNTNIEEINSNKNSKINHIENNENNLTSNYDMISPLAILSQPTYGNHINDSAATLEEREAIESAKSP